MHCAASFAAVRDSFMALTGGSRHHNMTTAIEAEADGRRAAPAPLHRLDSAPVK
jgi:hypothetical protein